MFSVAADAVYVSVTGQDSWDGTSRRPVASLARAVEITRARHAHRIIVSGGEYDLRTTLSLDSRDSGLTIAAKRGTRPVVTGAIVVPSSAIRISEDEDLQERAKALNPQAAAYTIDSKLVTGITLAPFTPYGFTRPVTPSPTEMFADAVPMVVARWPNTGYTTIRSVSESGNTEKERNLPPRQPKFFGVTDRAKNWKSIENAWLYGYWKYDWADETIKLHSVDPATGEITLDTPHSYGVDKGIPFFIENLKEELDAIGEYYVDPHKETVDFVADKTSHATYRLSNLGTALLSIKDAENVTIRGLDFSYSRADGAVLQNCSGTRLEDCQFYNLGERAALISEGHDSGLKGCNIWNTGEGGVTLTGGDRKTLTPAHLFVDNCDIHDYMRRTQTYRPAVSINGVGNRVSHCDLHDAPHSAIIFGGNDHVIEFNEFYRTVSRTGDGGVVYTGRDWSARGTRITDNYFHDNIGLSKWEPAIYFDDLASGITATRNVIERGNWGFLIGGGRDNVVTENAIIDCKLAFDCDARGLGWGASMKPTLTERLDAVPYQSDIWMQEYPALLNILNEDPLTPKGNVLEDNVLIRSGHLDERTEAAFKKNAQYKRNREVPTEADLKLIESIKKHAGAKRPRELHKS